MKYGKLHEDKPSPDAVQNTLNPTPEFNTQEPDEIIQDDEPDKEIFMETEKKLKYSSTKKSILYCCCGFMALVVIAIFVGYVFEKAINTEGSDQNTSDFIQSPTDIYRKFELITLKNSLQILLISDNKTDKSAAAINVAVGSNEDPNEYLGLAHFHEHMLFLGSETYPAEDAFSGYVSMNGGMDNAYTDKSHTNFFFEINNDHFSDALHIFSRFFIDPLLTHDAILKEIWAVDNEYRKDIPNQEWRNWRMLEYTANAQDPFSKFSIGSIETLNKSDIYDAMKAYHNKYFVSSIMKGVIYGNENIDVLKSYAIEYFSDIPSSDIESPKYENTIPYADDRIGKIYFIKPIDSTKTLSFLWSFVGDEYNLYNNYRSPVLAIIDNIITKKTENSLYNYLCKSMGWINDVSGEIFYDEYHWSGYLLSFQLTDSGLVNYEKIAKYLFQAIHILLDNISELELTYNDYICMQKLQFKFYSLIKQGAYDIVSVIARRMQVRDYKDLLYTELNVPPSRSMYNQTLIGNVLKYMNDPNNVIIYQIADNYTDYNLVEPFFQIAYANIQISEELKSEWSLKDDTSLKFQFSNPYIDQKCDLGNVKLIELSENEQSYYSKPELIVDDSNINVWYQPDTQFNASEIAINLLLISPLISSDIMNVTYMSIWIKLMQYMSSEWSSQPNDAGYSFDLSIDNQGIVIKFNCINSKYLDQFLDEFFDYFMSIQNYILSTDNDNIKLILNNILNNLYDDYNNLNYDSIWHQGFNKMYGIIENPFYSHFELLNQVSTLLNAQNTTIILGNVLNFISSIKQYGFLLEALFNGNLYKIDIENTYLSRILSHITIRNKQYLSSNNFLDNIPIFKHVNLKLNDINQWVYKGYNSNPDDTNDLNEFYFQFNANNNHLETCKVLLTAKMMSSESFEVLRTQEALGYIATTFARTTFSTNNINYIVVLVASGRDQYTADYLQERIIHFVNYFYDTFLNEVSDESFQSYINATISDINPKYLTLSDETTFLWGQIMGHTYFWNKSTEFENILRSEEITLKGISEFYQMNMLGGNRKWLSVQLYSDKNTKCDNNITEYGYNLNNDDFKDQFVYFNATKDIQKVNDITFFDVY